jgi:hypothetical protein
MSLNYRSDGHLSKLASCYFYFLMMANVLQSFLCHCVNINLFIIVHLFDSMNVTSRNPNNNSSHTPGQSESNISPSYPPYQSSACLYRSCCCDRETSPRVVLSISDTARKKVGRDQMCLNVPQRLVVNLPRR